MKPCHAWWRDEEAIHSDDYVIYEDFAVFVDLAWQAVGLPKPTKTQLEIARYLQHGPDQKIILAFRGVAKSWLTSAFVLWRLLRDHQLRFLVVSAGQDRADNFTTFCFQLMNAMPLLARLIPGPEQRRSIKSFDVAPARPDHTPSVSSRGITGQIVGLRADVIIADDIEIPKNSATEPLREKLDRNTREFAAILKPDGESCYLGTAQSQKTIYLNKPTYQIRIWPAEYPELKKKNDVAYWSNLAPRVREALENGTASPGDPVDPERFPSDVLAAKRDEYGRSEYRLQFMLDTAISDLDKFPLRLSDLIVTDIDNDRAPTWHTWASGPDQVIPDLDCVGLTGQRYHRPMAVSKDLEEYEARVMSIDPAGTGKDEVGVCVAFGLRSQVFVKLCAGLRGGYSDANLIQIARWAATYKVHRILIEENFGGGMFAKLLQPFLIQYAGGVTIEDIRAMGQKEVRIIDSIEPLMNRHKLIVDTQVLRGELALLDDEGYGLRGKLYMLAHQMAFITKERGALAQDDRLDALQIAVAHFIDTMHHDEKVAVDQAKDEAFDKWLEELEEQEDWRNHQIRGVPQRSSFVDPYGDD